MVVDRVAALQSSSIPSDVTLDRARWQPWLTAWLHMQARAQARGWQLDALVIAAPAPGADIDELARRHGCVVPGQLRQLLTEFAAEVRLGWHTSVSDEPRGELRRLNHGGIRGTLWSADLIEAALQNFETWRPRAGHARDTEQPNSPSLWQQQFAWQVLPNGDMLTIDTRNPEPTLQPVRYFSHEAEGLHGRALAPNLFAFVGTWSALGCVGSSHDEWQCVAPVVTSDVALLDVNCELAQRWREWVAHGPFVREPDEAPAPVFATSNADRALLTAAQRGDQLAVKAALHAGAKIDCCAADPKHYTALIYAAVANNVPLMQQLLDAGAAINTTLPVLTVAAFASSPATVQWLIEHGARRDRWREDRYCPLHEAISRAERKPDQVADAFAILQMLLAAGADPNAGHDAISTMAKTTPLMRVGARGTKVLLAAGADVQRRDLQGRTAMHYVQVAEAIPMLVAAGLDVNVMSTAVDAYPAHTPLQALLVSHHDPTKRVVALLAAGADPHCRDSAGATAWWYCTHAGTFDALLPYGFSVDERNARGQTLLHRAIEHAGGVLYGHFAEYAERLVANGFDINAADNAGNTVLHITAKNYDHKTHALGIHLLLRFGADKTRANRAGKRAFQLVKKQHADIVALLK